MSVYELHGRKALVTEVRAAWGRAWRRRWPAPARR